MKLVFFRYAASVIAVLFASLSVAALDSLEPPALSTFSQYKALVVEYVYPINVTQYALPNRVQFPPTVSPAKTPEDALSQFFASMKSADIVWNSAMWTPESLSQMNDRDQRMGVSNADWVARWAKRKSWSYEFTHQIRYGKYVLIAYRAFDGSAKAIETDTMALVQREQRWYLTQELSDDPVLDGWNSPTARIQRSPASLIR